MNVPAHVRAAVVSSIDRRRGLGGAVEQKILSIFEIVKILKFLEIIFGRVPATRTF